MPTEDPFPLNINDKTNSPELLAYLMQFGKTYYLSADEINLILKAIQYLYENLGSGGPGSTPNLAQVLLQGNRGVRIIGTDSIIEAADKSKILICNNDDFYTSLPDNVTAITDELIIINPENDIPPGIVITGATTVIHYNGTVLTQGDYIQMPPSSVLQLICTSINVYVAILSGNIPKTTLQDIISNGGGEYYGDGSLGFSDGSYQSAISAYIVTIAQGITRLSMYAGSLQFTKGTFSVGVSIETQTANGNALIKDLQGVEKHFAFEEDVNALLDNKVDEIAGYGLSQQNFSSIDKAKLDSLSNYAGFRGAQSSLANIVSAYPTGTLGDWAIITNPSGAAFFAIWDTDIPAWVEAGQSPTIPGANLAYTVVGNVLTITSDTGNDVVIPLATSSASGLQSKEDKSKLDSMTAIFTTALKLAYDNAVSSITNLMVKSANGSDILNITTFRANLGVDKLTSNGNSNYPILATDKAVVTSANLTSSRTWSLPLANAVNAGYEIIVADLFGGVTSVNTLIIVRAGSDTINGTTSVTIGAQYGMRRLISDGVSKWTFDGGVMRISDYIGNTLTANKLIVTDANGKLINGIDASFVDFTSSGQTQINQRVKTISSKATTGTALTGTTSEGILETFTIPANELVVGNILKLWHSPTKTGIAGTSITRIRINTTNTLTGSVVIATGVSLAASNISGSSLERHYNIRPGNVLEGFNFTSAAQYENSASSSARSTTTYEPTQILYVFITGQLGNSADSIAIAQYINEKY